MAEGRMIKKEIKKSKKMAALKNDKGRTLYFMIYPHVDIEGRISADAIDIKAECIPLFGWAETTIERALEDLHAVGLIVLYVIDEKRYLEIERFHDFQRIDRGREAKSLIPAPPAQFQSSPELSRELAISKVKLSKVKLSKEGGAFAPPSLSDVAKYCKERKNKINPEAFINHYQSKGWMIGKNKMKDWRAAIRTWEIKDKEAGAKGLPGRSPRKDDLKQKHKQWSGEKRFAGTKQIGR